MSTAVVDIYLAGPRIRAEIPMSGFSRVADIFNGLIQDERRAPGMRLRAKLLDVDPQHRAVEAPDLGIWPQDIRLVHPISEPPSSPEAGEERRDRVAVKVMLYVDAWQFSGTLYLIDRVPWVDFMATTRDQFVPVTNASVRFETEAEPTAYSFLLVNGARISAVYELP